MGKIRSMMPGAALLLVLLLCTACGAKQMPVNVIETAILEKDDVYNTYGLEDPSFLSMMETMTALIKRKM